MSPRQVGVQPPGYPVAWRDMHDLLAELQRMQAEIDKLAPLPRYLIARHDVPYGKLFRMWDTRGQMHAYVNRGQIHDLAYRSYKSTSVHPFGLARPDLTGIPVFEE